MSRADDALIHLRVPAALKARWVRMSRAKGQRLTDWIVERVERTEEPTMQTYPIPESLAEQYNGAGYALAAITGGQVVAIRYLRDISPLMDDAEAEGGHIAHAAALAVLDADSTGQAVRELQAVGNVAAGMVSAWEFVEL